MISTIESNSLESKIPHVTNGLAEKAEDLARRGIAQARHAGTVARERAMRVGDQTVGYIKDEPLKAVLIAAAVGAIAALLVGWTTTRSRDSGR